jgi:DNA-binding NarL/FixJ family response regulator
MTHHSSADEITVVIADDHPVFRMGLRATIDEAQDIRVLAEAEDGVGAYNAVLKHKPRIAVLDIEMPGMSGLAVAERIRREALPTEVIMLTMFDDKEIFDKAMQCGASGYLLKDSALIDILRGIRRVASGEYYISPALTGSIMQASKNMVPTLEWRYHIQQLTPAERNVLALIARERTSKEIADELHISIRTVEHHRTHIIDKLQLSGSFALLRFAIEHREML